MLHIETTFTLPAQRPTEDDSFDYVLGYSCCLFTNRTIERIQKDENKFKVTYFVDNVKNVDKIKEELNKLNIETITVL